MSPAELADIAVAWMHRAVKPMRTAIFRSNGPDEASLLCCQGFESGNLWEDPSFSLPVLREVLTTDRALVACDQRGPYMRSILCVPVHLAEGRYLLYCDHRATWRPYAARDLRRLQQVARELERKFGAAPPPARRSPSVRLPAIRPPVRGRASVREVAVLLRSLQALYAAGLMLDRALYVLGRSQPPGPARQACEAMYIDVRQGQPLSLAMSKHPHLFSAQDAAMVQVGEQSGALDKVLRLLADGVERRRMLQARWRSVIVYPALLAAICLSLLLVILPMLLRGQLQLLAQSGAGLPFATVLVLGYTRFVQSPLFWLLGGAAIFWLTRLPSRVWSRLYRRLPLVGSLYRLTGLCHFCWSLSTALAAGYNCRYALTLSAGSLADPELEKAARTAAEHLKEGCSVTESLRSAGVFPRLLLETVGVGEECGTLPDSLESTARLLEQDLEARATTFCHLLEPAVLGLMGLVCGFFALASVLPMLSLLESL